MMYRRNHCFSQELHFVTIRHSFLNPTMAQFGDSRRSLEGLPGVRKLQGPPMAARDYYHQVRAAAEEGELALLAQFMRYDLVASLADAIAKRARVRGEDLIAAAGLDPRRSASDAASPVAARLSLRKPQGINR